MLTKARTNIATPSIYLAAMAAANAPITMKEILTLPSIGINQQFITFTNVTMESEKYICVRETSPQNSVVIVDMSMPMRPLRRPITADSALMNPDSRILALKASLPGTTQDHLQIFNIELKAKLKSYQMPEQVSFWKWITPKLLGLVTRASVYHWSIEGESEPVKMFDRTANLANTQIINYRCDPSEKWLVLIGIAPGSPEKPKLVKGNMQLFSVDQQRSQALEAHAASFASFKVSGNENPSILISFATNSINARQVTSKLHVIELGAQPGKAAFTKKQADLFFPPEFSDDFPVAMQISHRYSLIYLITKLGLLFVYDLETATALYRNRISPDPIFLTCEASSVGGFYAINRRGQVLLATVNESTIVPFVSGKLNNLELAVNLAKRGNLPGAENLVVQRFQELFAQTKYKEAAELAAESPQGILRTSDTVVKFQSVPVHAGQTPPLLQYFGTLLTRGKLNAFESLELSRLVVNQNKKNLLENWLAEDKLECTEELGDLVKTVDNDLALKIYIKARATTKVVAAFAEQQEFDKILIYSKQVGYTPDYMFLLQTILRSDPQVGYSPDYLFLLQTILRSDPQGAVNFALMMSQMEGGCPVDYNTISGLFLQRNLIQEATAFLLDVLKPNLPEHAFLQTKVLEMNLVTFPNVADAILANGMFCHYDRPRIAQLCEKAGLYVRALQHYAELPDIKRVMVNTHAIETQSLVEFFGTLSKEWALECMKGLLLVNLRGNLQIVVQVAKEYSEQLGVDSCIKIFEQFKSSEGLYLFLGSYLSSSEDPDIHFKYIDTLDDDLAVKIYIKAGITSKVVQRFQELFAQTKYEEAAELAAESPILRTPDAVAKFQCIPLQGGETPLLQYFIALLSKGKLNAFESIELSRLVIVRNQTNVLDNYIVEDKLECTEELGDIVKTVDKDLALKIYVKAGAYSKCFQELFSQTKYEEAAELAANHQGTLRNSDTVAKFQSVPVQDGQTPPLLQYFCTLLTKGKLNAFESLELSRLVVNHDKRNLLDNWLADDKLECTEELKDLVKVIQYFHALFSQTKYKEAATLAVEYQGVLRTPDTLAKFQSVPVQAGQTSPLLQYFETLLIKGKLNAFESIELSRLVVNQNKKNLLEIWLAEDKLECTEELGDFVRTVDNDLALKIYMKAKATSKVVEALSERREFDKLLIYSKQVGYTPPDFLFLLQTILRSDFQGAVKFALIMSRMEGGCPVDYNTIADLFLQKNLIREATTFLLDVLKPDLAEHAFLQTKVLEINIATFPNVVDAILEKEMFSHYDRPRISQLCKEAGLYVEFF